MTTYLLTRPAEQDLSGITTYLVGEGGPVLALEILNKIDQAFERLGAMPGIGHTRTDLTSRPVKFWPVFPYLVVYDAKPRPIQIIRILDGRRDLAKILAS